MRAARSCAPRLHPTGPSSRNLELPPMSAVTQGTVTSRTAGQPAAPYRLVALLVVSVLPLGMVALEWGRFGTTLAMWWPAAGVAVIAATLVPRRHRPLLAR